jgi:hypothetical protein
MLGLMRILVTGSRDWDDIATVLNALIVASNGQPVTVVHGACPTGADKIADDLCAAFRVPAERHPADWGKYGKRAGFVRNAEMVALGADVCLAFIRNGSKGATMTADLAERAGIRTVRFTVDNPPNRV